ncbi:uncharacterized protein ARMOST_06952 [Armillaria ostoyae]|uniref:Uncharacterized protein n=1 Tax=Armillaria ostoyae TaxID=47428 RepID=A0A284R4H8_ARMOS|nr:uncharacterized protein ARMOST_06952 [Armillaria ostoyae]
MTKIHKETEAARKMKKQYDKNKRDTKNYSVGDLVWLDATNLHLPQPKKKLNDKQDNGDVHYLTQRNNGTQKWVKNPDEAQWKEFLNEYWASQADTQYESPLEEP